VAAELKHPKGGGSEIRNQKEAREKTAARQVGRPKIENKGQKIRKEEIWPTDSKRPFPNENGPKRVQAKKPKPRRRKRKRGGEKKERLGLSRPLFEDAYASSHPQTNKGPGEKEKTLKGKSPKY